MPLRRYPKNTLVLKGFLDLFSSPLKAEAGDSVPVPVGTRSSFLTQQPHSSLLGLPMRKDTAFRSSSPVSLHDAEFGLKKDSPVQKDDTTGEVLRVSKTDMRPLLLKSTGVSA